MPIPNTPKPRFPAVPVAPGVPPVLRQAGAIQSTVVQLVADVGQIAALFGAPQWGIFTTAGAPVIAADTVLDVEYRQENRISAAPQEQGAFLSYNKVADPFPARVTLPQGDTADSRTAFLNEILDAQASLDLYTLVTPEITYPSVNVTHHDYRRTSVSGVTLLAVDVWVEQVRVTGTSQFSNTQQPAGADQVNGGTVQPQAPTAAQTSALPPGDDSGPGSGGAGAGNTTIGQPSQAYFDSNGNQLGVAPSTTAAEGPVVGQYANGQPVIGGAWQQGFFDSNLNWVHP